MKRPIARLVACVGVLFACAACRATESVPLLQMRLRANDTATYEIWKSNLCAFAKHPGCCDEVWFSTGTGVPSIDWHRGRAAVLEQAAADVRKMGIVPSLQFQSTLGHGDRFGSPDTHAAKRWKGWTDWKGVETQYCNCPRQPAFLAYLDEISRIYARVGFSSLWIDDDLRYKNHRPADNDGVHIGCWCETCVGEFNKATNGEWSRDGLGQAVESDPALAARWRAFSVESLCVVAQTIATAFHDVSPSTRMALQHGLGDSEVDPVLAILKSLYETSGKPVGYRPGGGAYYDRDPNAQVLKSFNAGRFRNRLGDPLWVCEWTPEIESWPRTYYSRSGQSVMVEAFTALMYGMNRVSYFVSNSEKEEPELYAQQFWKPLADASPVLRGYARIVGECRAVGCSLPDDIDVPDAMLIHSAVPVFAGVGIDMGVCTRDEAITCPWEMTSRDVQALRSRIDARCGGFPAMLASPFYGLMLPHVDGRGKLRAVALVNERIDAQQSVRVVLRNLPEGVSSVVWHELRRPNRRLNISREGGDYVVVIPEIGAWNAGFLCFETGAVPDNVFRDNEERTATAADPVGSAEPYELSKADDSDIVHRVETFRRLSGTKKSVRTILIAASGLKPGKYSGNVMAVVKGNDLFRE